MTTILIADVHNRIGWIEKGLLKLKELYNYDKVVFLGDYFDRFYDSPYQAGQTAAWLRQSLQHEDRIHLLGNHDMPYMCPNNETLWCPGFTPTKWRVIDVEMHDHWDKLKPAHYDQGWLLSHAGFNEKIVANPVTGIPTAEQLVEMAEEGLQIVKAGLPHPLFMPGARMEVSHGKIGTMSSFR